MEMEKSKSLIKKLSEDKEFQSGLVVAAQTAVTKEEKIAATTKFANEAGYEISPDELQRFIASNLLSDDDLNNVAGGYSKGEVIGGTAGCVAGAIVGGTVGGSDEAFAGAVVGALVGEAIGGKCDDAVSANTHRSSLLPIKY